MFVSFTVLILAQPANFLYSVLYCLYKKLGHTPRAQKFVSEICSQVEERSVEFPNLTSITVLFKIS